MLLYTNRIVLSELTKWFYHSSSHIEILKIEDHEQYDASATYRNNIDANERLQIL